MTTYKSILFLSILCLFSFSIAYELVVLGDTGQFDEFNQNVGDLTKDSQIFKFEKGICRTTSDTELKGFSNFRSVLEQDINSVKRYICKGDEVAILGDMSYPEITKNEKVTSDIPKYEGYKNRLLCMWSIFKEMWKNVENTCPKDSPNPLQEKTESGKYKHLELLFGNHSYDVDIDIESDQISSMVESKGRYIDGSSSSQTEREGSPKDLKTVAKIERVVKDNVVIEFLDSNFLPMLCYLKKDKKESKYPDCKYVKKKYGKFPSYAEAKFYTEQYIEALKSFDPKADWRVIRAHHPFFNQEGEDSLDPFWTEKVADDKTLLEHIRDAKVNLILASHTHTTQVQLFPWVHLDGLKKRYKTDDLKYIGEETFHKVDGTVCADEATCVYPPCYYNNKFFKGNELSYECSQKHELTISHSIKDPKYLLTLIVGNSGREFDPAYSDQQMPSAVIYANSNKSFGGANISFKKDSIKAEYFSKSEVIFTLNTVNDDGRYPILEGYCQEKIQGKIMNGTNFDYNQYSSPLTMLSFLEETQ
jgi:hypothetical protein